MKKIFTLILLAIGFVASAQNLGIRTATPNATLDVVGDPATAATPDGILMPRITLAELNAKIGYGANQAGAVVYVTDITGATNDQTDAIFKIGYYRFTGTKWVPMLPKFVGFEANTSNHLTLAAGETQQIMYTTKAYDTNNWFDLATGRFTPKVAGYYDVTASAGIYQANLQRTKNVQLYKNGQSIAIGYTITVPAHNSRLNVVVYMNGTTDYLDVRVYSVEAATTTNGVIAPYNHFQANLIGLQ